MIGRLLGIDPGTKRIGFAVSDDLQWTARPLEVWKRRTLEVDLAHVRSLVEEHEVREIVIGVPYRLGGGASESTERARAFAEALKAALPDMPVIERDEALTTFEAESRLEARGLSPGERKALVDAYAAAVILQEELDERSRCANRQGGD